MSSKVAAARIIVEFLKTCEALHDGEAIEAELKRVREAFEAVIAAAASSQTPPVDFKQGEPGIAECACAVCSARRSSSGRCDCNFCKLARGEMTTTDLTNELNR